MKKPTIAVTGQKKGRLADGYNWKLGTLVFDKEERDGRNLKLYDNNQTISCVA